MRITVQGDEGQRWTHSWALDPVLEVREAFLEEVTSESRPEKPM